MNVLKFWCSSYPGSDKEDAFEVEIKRYSDDIPLADFITEAAETACEKSLYDSSEHQSELEVYVVDEMGHEWQVSVTVDFNPCFTGGIEKKQDSIDEDMTIKEFIELKQTKKEA